MTTRILSLARRTPRLYPSLLRRGRSIFDSIFLTRSPHQGHLDHDGGPEWSRVYTAADLTAHNIAASRGRRLLAWDNCYSVAASAIANFSAGYQYYTPLGVSDTAEDRITQDVARYVARLSLKLGVQLAQQLAEGSVDTTADGTPFASLSQAATDRFAIEDGLAVPSAFAKLRIICPYIGAYVASGQRAWVHGVTGNAVRINDARGDHAVPRTDGELDSRPAETFRRIASYRSRAHAERMGLPGIVEGDAMPDLLLAHPPQHPGRGDASMGARLGIVWGLDGRAFIAFRLRASVGWHPLQDTASVPSRASAALPVVIVFALPTDWTAPDIAWMSEALIRCGVSHDSETFTRTGRRAGQPLDLTLPVSGATIPRIHARHASTALRACVTRTLVRCGASPDAVSLSRSAMATLWLRMEPLDCTTTRVTRSSQRNPNDATIIARAVASIRTAYTLEADRFVASCADGLEGVGAATVFSGTWCAPGRAPRFALACSRETCISLEAPQGPPLCPGCGAHSYRLAGRQQARDAAAHHGACRNCCNDCSPAADDDGDALPARHCVACGVRRREDVPLCSEHGCCVTCCGGDCATANTDDDAEWGDVSEDGEGEDQQRSGVFTALRATHGIYESARYIGTEVLPLTETLQERKARRNLGGPVRWVGVEIEIDGFMRDSYSLELSRELEALHVTRTRDGSLSASGVELVTPPWRGAVFVAAMARVSTALASCRPVVTDACGLHVHVDARDIVRDQSAIARVIALWSSCEAALFQMVPRKRRQNHYCREIGMCYGRMAGEATAFVQGSRTPEQWRRSLYLSLYQVDPKGEHAAWYEGDPTPVRGVVSMHKGCGAGITSSKADKGGANRYAALNVHSLYYRGTFEVRLHSGTYQAHKITGWAQLMAGLVDVAVRTPAPVLGSLVRAACADIPAADRPMAVLAAVATRAGVREYVSRRLGQWSAAEAQRFARVAENGNVVALAKAMRGGK